MQSYSSAHCVLICLVTSVFTAVYASIEVKVNVSEPATLPCRCTNFTSATWSQNSSGVVAECTQTSCSAMREGFEMSHEQSLKGNISLFIRVAELSMIGVYVCRCNYVHVTTAVLRVRSLSPVMAKLHDSATLPCNVTCHGLAAWTRSKHPSEILARCNETSCQSMKARYQMSYDQYLKGDLSLTITDADFSMRDTYTCQCNGAHLSDVGFTIIAANSSVHINPGETLVLDLDVSDPVEVLSNSTDTDGASSGQICSLQCNPKYTPRAALELKRMNLSDSGVYIIQDSGTKEVFHIYTVTVQDDLPSPDNTTSNYCCAITVPLLALSLCLNAVTVAIMVYQCKKKRSPNGVDGVSNDVAGNGGNQNIEEERILPQPYQQHQ